MHVSSVSPLFKVTIQQLNNDNENIILIQLWIVECLECIFIGHCLTVVPLKGFTLENVRKC